MDVWVKNVESGLSWRVTPERAKYLLGQRNADNEPAYEKTSAPRPKKPAESPKTPEGNGGEQGDGKTPAAK